MELAIDTSTSWGGLAISLEGSLIAELTWKPGQNHTSELFPNVERLLQTAKADFRSLTAVFVAIGPGSFNGLRAGISAAKGLAFSLNLPLVGISTLETAAIPFAFTGLPLCPVHDAGRGEIATALYCNTDGWRQLKKEHLTTIETLCEKTDGKTLFCGEIPPAAVEQIRSSLGDNAVIPTWEQRLRRPGYISYLGWQRLKSGQYSNPTALQPLYLRQPPITQRKKKY
ncbi:MAG: tRNA (adenosine(37)-N6)-threonylcarbamoyltransferase complex dimerization subunit type 1 TsaB [Dehalococcoidia bacterium]|nr:tRNA (adenosine(37)-N6)-threonylcarbamoyltransferase complex dimerization subunit type 1 TsaB [Dehalococcoidia bacterium]